jgi:hypothetical protein
MAGAETVTTPITTLVRVRERREVCVTETTA